MKVMPVVVLNAGGNQGYVNVNTEYFSPTTEGKEGPIFVALMHTKVDAEGQKSAEFQKFVPCSQVKDQEGYLAFDYATQFKGSVPLRTLEGAAKSYEPS